MGRQEQYHGYEGMMNWISVKDRMPKKDRRVLIMAQEMDGTWDDIFIGALRYENTDDWDIEALDCCSVAWFNNPVITHWMPLPRNA